MEYNEGRKKLLLAKARRIAALKEAEYRYLFDAGWQQIGIGADTKWRHDSGGPTISFEEALLEQKMLDE